METEAYAIYEKDNLTLHLLPPVKDIGQMEFYLEVDDVDKLWQEIENQVLQLKHRKPFDREYGMREVHLELPYTRTLMFIGQCI